MPNKISLDSFVSEWLKKAKDDELNASSILRHRDGAPCGVCFLAQQMTEKLLKAFLIQEKNNYPKIHANDKLLELCIIIDGSFKKLKKDAIYLTDFYQPARYPEVFYDFS